jgi:multidrug efflux pump
MSGTPHFVPGRGNLSRWAIEHPALLRFFIVLILLLGVRSYFQLGQAEDPFTYKVMLIQAQWPGATAQEVSEQLTERIEKSCRKCPIDGRASQTRRDRVFVNIMKTVRGARGAGAVVPGPQEGRRHPPHAAARGARAVLQRRIR